jgi:hypothetical protein
MGYEEHTTKTKIAHLLYMDNLKLLSKSEDELQKQIQTVTTFSDDIHMEFRFDKCAKIVFKKGKLVHSQNLVVDIAREIHKLQQGKTYKYLVAEESDGIQHQQIKEKLKKEYTRRLRVIVKSELNAKNKTTSIGALAVPVLRYSFGIINWILEEIKKTDGKTRKILTMYKLHHPKADVDRLYVKKQEGASALSQIEAAYKTEIINIAECLNKKHKEDQFVNIIRSHNSSQPNMNLTVRTASKVIDELSQPNENNDMKQDEIQNTKARLEESLKEKWENKVMGGQYIRSIDKHLISVPLAAKGDLKAETESKIVAAQDQALQTKYHATNTL